MDTLECPECGTVDVVQAVDCEYSSRRARADAEDAAARAEDAAADA